MNFLGTVWAVLAIVGVLVVGIALRLAKVFELKDIAPLNRFVFAVGIPCLAFKSMATRNFAALDWRFVLAFLAVRACGCLGAALYTIARRQPLGQFSVHYLATTWMDAITFGVPVATAMFDATVGTVYPVLAALSSFIFELPIILVSFELHQSRIRRMAASAAAATEAAISPATESVAPLLSAGSGDVPDASSSSAVPSAEKKANDRCKCCTGRWRSVGSIALNVLIHIARMPPVIGIFFGLIYSALPMSLTGGKLPKVVDSFCSTLGACVTPLATFNVGMFICDGAPFRRVWRKTLVYLPIKHILLPLVAIGIAKLFNLESPAGEIAVIVASLPLAFPAFTLVHVYQGLPDAEDIMSTCISAGCVLLLPITALWTLFLHKVPIFPLPTASSSAASSSF